MSLLAESLAVGFKAAGDLADDLQLHLRSKVQLSEHLRLPPYLGGPRLVIKYVRFTPI